MGQQPSAHCSEPSTEPSHGAAQGRPLLSGSPCAPPCSTQLVLLHCATPCCVPLGCMEKSAPREVRAAHSVDEQGYGDADYGNVSDFVPFLVPLMGTSVFWCVSRLQNRTLLPVKYALREQKRLWRFTSLIPSQWL